MVKSDNNMIDIEFDSPENIKIYQEKLLGKALKYLEENSRTSY